VAGHIRSDLGLELTVDAVSIKAGSSHLLEKWLSTEILPLYERHAELARQSLNRKIGALRLAVEAALKARLKRSGHTGAGIDIGKLRDLETEIRTAAGKIARARTECLDKTDAFRQCADDLIREAANHTTGEGPIKNMLEQAAAEPVAQIASAIREAARNAGSVLANAAMALRIENGPEPDELQNVLKNMPRFDLGNLEIPVRSSKVAALLGRRWAAARVERRIRSQAGDQIMDAVAIYARVLHAWVRKTFTELQEQFDSYADAYRAHLDRLSANRTGGDDDQALRDHLAALGVAQVPAGRVSAAAPESAAGQTAPGTAA
jgi:hypothetical protein